MDATRQTFRCGPRWWSALLSSAWLALCAAGTLLPVLRDPREPGEATSRAADSIAILNGMAAVAIGIGAAVMLVIAGLRLVRAYDVVLEERSVRVPRYPLVTEAQSIDYESINDVQLKRRRIAPTLTIYHTDGAAQVFGSRFRLKELERLYRELAFRIRTACAEEVFR